MAQKYLKVLKSLGVEVGLAKSIISKRGLGLEFAKRTIFKGVDVSPIPFKEQSAAHRNLSSLVSFVEKYKLSPLQALRFLGYGYKVDPTKVNSRIVRTLMVSSSIPKTYKDLEAIFSTCYGYLDFNL